MKRRYPRSLNHSRVDVYKVSKRTKHHNFVISPQYLHEETLRFVYEENGETFEKIIPLSYLGPHLHYVPFYSINDFTLCREYRGGAYFVKEEVIFNY